jgi:hypothetical protein
VAIADHGIPKTVLRFSRGALCIALPCNVDHERMSIVVDKGLTMRFKALAVDKQTIINAVLKEGVALLEDKDQEPSMAEN